MTWFFDLQKASYGSQRSRIYTVFFVGSLLFAASSCGNKVALSPPGAGGDIVFQMWGDPGTDPTIVHTDKLSQHGSLSDHLGLQMEPVKVRRPIDKGVVYIEAPIGDYQSDASDTIVLQGPVHMTGTMNGEPIIGLAQRAIIRRSDRRMELIGAADAEHHVQVIYRGALLHSERLFIDDQHRVSSHPFPYQQGPAPAALTAALAALPRPLALPEMNTTAAAP